MTTMTIETEGLIIRAVDYGESGRIFTVLSSDMGKISFIANGVRKARSYLAPAQLFSYNKYSLSRGGSGAYTLRNVERLHAFEGLTLDIEALAYASYFADVAYHLSHENSPEPLLLRLLLNTFHMLSSGRAAARKLKPIFELRAMSVCGLAPNEEMCEEYGAKGGVLKAMRHITDADDSRLFAFELPDEAVAALSYITEEYVRVNLDRNLRTLEYLKKLG